jgi:tRNA threonylcarbamoyladenosine biosynthesis protein TsaB
MTPPRSGVVLGIESTGRLTGAALARGDELLAESSLAVEASSQEWLLRLVHEVLERQSLEVADLERIAVSIGPGSFTGVRVGLAAARVLAWSVGRALVPVPTHQALAYPWRDSGHTICLLTSHRRGLVCVETGSWQSQRWRAAIAASAVPVESLEPRLRAARADSGGSADSLLFVGEAVESILEAVPSLRSLGRPLLDPLTRARRPGPVALLGAVLDPAPADEIDRVEPLYLRDADAVKPGSSIREGERK